MATSIVPANITSDPNQNSEAIGNISDADLIFYRNVELQTELVQRYRNAILNMVVTAASAAKRETESARQAAVESVAKIAADHKKAVHEQLDATARPLP